MGSKPGILDFFNKITSMFLVNTDVPGRVLIREITLKCFTDRGFSSGGADKRNGFVGKRDEGFGKLQFRNEYVESEKTSTRLGSDRFFSLKNCNLSKCSAGLKKSKMEMKALNMRKNVVTRWPLN